MTPEQEKEFEDLCLGENGLLIDNPSERLPELKTYISRLLHEERERIREEILEYKAGGVHLPPEEQRINDLLDEIANEI